MAFADDAVRALKSDSLYVHRSLLNADAIRVWAKERVLTSTPNIPPSQPQMEKLALSRSASATSLGLRQRSPLCACWRASVYKAGIGIYSAVGGRGAV